MRCFPGAVLLIALVAVAPSAKSATSDKFIVNSELFIVDFLIHTSDSDIVSLTMPLNLKHSNDKTDDSNSNESSFESNSSSAEDSNSDPILYFVKGDINDKGHKVYKGLYSLKDGKETMVLESGTDAAASDDDTTEVYFSAKDGIYVIDAKTNETKKYGTLTDSLIGIVKANGSDVLYVLTENHFVYKVTDGGDKNAILPDAKDAQQIVLDSSNNLYFYSEDKVPYAITENGMSKIYGTPKNPTYAQLIKPPSSIKNGVLFAADDNVYIVYANGTGRQIDVVLEVKPTAYAPEAGILQYYSYDKKIYAFNYLQFIFSKLPIGVKKVLEEKLREFQSTIMISRLNSKS